jgi:hypothetical protein
MEAILAGSILVLIVWWTMFHGRNKGEKKEFKSSEEKDSR